MYYPMDDDYNKSETKKMSKSDKKHYGDYNGMMMAKEDVHMMMEYAEVMKDKKRYKRAMYCAMKKKEELEMVTHGSHGSHNSHNSKTSY